MALTVGELQAIITANNDKFESAIDSVIKKMEEMSKETQKNVNKANDSLKDMDQMMQNIESSARVLESTIARPLLSFVKASFLAQTSLVETENLFNEVFKSNKKEANDWARSVTNSLNLSIESVKNGAGQFQNMFQSLDFANDAAFRMTQELTVLSYDLKSFFNLSSADEAMQKLQSGLMGNVMALRGLGVFLNEASIKQYAYEAGIAEVGQELTQQQKTMAIYLGILDQTRNAQGDWERTMSSSSNQLEILNTKFLELQQNVGAILESTFGPLLKVFVSIVSAVSSFTKSLSEMNIVAKVMVTILLIAIPLLVLGTVTVLVFSKAYRTLSKAIAQSTALQKIFNATLLKTVGMVLAVIAVFVALSYIFRKNKKDTEDSGEAIDDETSNIDDNTDAIKANQKARQQIAGFDELNLLSNESSSDTDGMDFDFSEYLNQQQQAIDQAAELDSVTGNLTKTLDGLEVVIGLVSIAMLGMAKNTVLAMLPAIIIGAALFGLYKIIEKLIVSWDDLSGAEKVLYIALASLLAIIIVVTIATWAFNAALYANPIVWIIAIIIVLIALIALVVIYWDEIVAWIKKTFADIVAWLQNAWDNVVAFFQGIWEWIVNLFNNIKQFFIDVWTAIVDWFKEVINNIVEFFVNAWESILSFFKGIGEGIKNTFNSVINWIVNTFNSVVEWFRGVFQTIGNFFSSLWDGVKEGFKGFVNFFIKGMNVVIKGLNKISFDVPDWVPLIGGKKWGFNIKEIPLLARGGVLDGGQTFIAGEGGRAELVGSYQGKTTVMPLENTSFVDAMGQSVYAAVVSAMASSGGGQGTIIVQIDGEDVAYKVDTVRTRKGMNNNLLNVRKV